MTLQGIVSFGFLLQFEACLSVSYFQRVGLDVTLSCEDEAESDPTCTNVSWLYNKDNSITDTVSHGKTVQEISEQFKRFNVDNSCSLVIKNLTAEDYGLYTCRIGQSSYSDSQVHLNILTISALTPDPGDRTVVTCSLNRYHVLGSCDSNSIQWKDEKGNTLQGVGEDYEVQSHQGCTFYLTWTRPGDSSRRITCQWVEGDEVKVEASYPPVLPGGPGDKKDKNSDSDPILSQHIILIIIGSAVAVMMVLLISGVAYIKYKNRGNITKGVQKPISQQLDEADSGVIYLDINHAVNQRTSSFREVEMEEVTYSGVKTEDLSSIYSNVNKLK